MTKALGVDLGEVRIGLAVSDDLGMLAHPLETIRADEKPGPVEKIAQIVLARKVEVIVVGMPRNMNARMARRPKRQNFLGRGSAPKSRAK